MGKPVGESEKPRFIARFWQGIRLLETALKEMDADAEGWELVSHTYTSTLFYLLFERDCRSEKARQQG